MRKLTITQPKKPRNFRMEYQQRVERGIKAGKSRSAARGHPRAEDLGPLPPVPLDRSSGYEKALKAMKRGASLRSAAADFGLMTERLRRHVKQRTSARYEGGKWVIFDLRPQPVFIASRGRLRTIVVALDDASEVGRYWDAVSKFLETNDQEYLEPFAGEGVRDAKVKFYPFEVRPNVLRKLDSIGELSFIELYAPVVP
jgi:hypothetical protein